MSSIPSLETALTAHYYPRGGGHVCVGLVEYDEGQPTLSVQSVRYSPSHTGRGVAQTEAWSFQLCVPSVPSPAELIAITDAARSR